MNEPTTISEAVAAGWESLEARCDKCRYSVLMPWRLLRMRSKSEELTWIMEHAVCQRCGNGVRPSGFALVRSSYRGSAAPTFERFEL
ncbi:hypothetical protein [Labrys miyagiensis]